jgi:hypothetical protein
MVASNKKIIYFLILQFAPCRLAAIVEISMTMQRSRRVLPILAAIVSLALETGVDAWVVVVPGVQERTTQLQRRAPLYSSPRDNNGEPEPLDWLQVGRKWIATATLAGVLMLSPDSIHSNAHTRPFWAPSPAWAGSILKEEGSQLDVSGSVFNEVWTLIDKYYIDRTFGGQVSARKCFVPT